ncbi:MULTISPECIES: RagB/SusD family nutrient uptake outer membrane protein [Butyricimonas]|uniref:RagB/SusD family nutrient uptake outer membrane protein n=1 Tax=Butyricimonas TaxID=574697 RepID=UPI0007FB54DF|nr:MULTISPECIES: RagB/SusD family nutrient uptake outer membrane protein [Butyricimonas]
MKNMKGKLFSTWMVVLCLALLGSGCGDFLEVYSKDQVYAASTSDLDEVLIGNGYMNSKNTYYPWLFLLDDDAEELIVATAEFVMNDCPIVSYREAATWQKDPFRRSNTAYTPVEDVTVKQLYAHVAYVNTIINYVDEFPNDPIEDRVRVTGEGQFLRGAYYLLLSNLYGWAYDVKNEGADPSVPLKLYEWVTDAKFSRATVGEVYSSIVSDLEQACENLRGVVQKNYYRANQLAARTLLSRVYLYMENYDRVIAQCDSALVLGCPLSDLNTYFTGTSAKHFFDRDYLYAESNPEIIFTMGNADLRDMFHPGRFDIWGSGDAQYAASPDLVEEYQKYPGDLRLERYLQRHSTAVGRYAVVKNMYGDAEGSIKNVTTPQRKVFETFLLRTVEVYLNKAEAQAMKGDLAGAVSTLQPLLATRYAAGQLPEVAALGEKELVEFIRSERRRELCFEGHRWPDLRRYAVNTKYPDKRQIVHTVYSYSGLNTGGNVAGHYVLKPYGEDEGWIMPFPENQITFGEGALENPDRPEREMAGAEDKKE